MTVGSATGLHSYTLPTVLSAGVCRLKLFIVSVLAAPHLMPGKKSAGLRPDRNPGPGGRFDPPPPSRTSSEGLDREWTPLDPTSSLVRALDIELTHPGVLDVGLHGRGKRVAIYAEDGVAKIVRVAEAVDDPAGDDHPDVRRQRSTLNRSPISHAFLRSMPPSTQCPGIC